MSSNLGEILRAKLAQQQLIKDMQPKPTLPPHKANPGKITNNINRATFAQVRDFPSSRADVIKAMVAKGYKEGSVSAVLSMMVNQRLAVRDADGILRVAVKEYVPLKNSRATAREELKRKNITVRRKNITITRKPAVQTPPPAVEAKRPVSTLETAWSVQSILNTLSVTQARELLDALKKLFGEAK